MLYTWSAWYESKLAQIQEWRHQSVVVVLYCMHNSGLAEPPLSWICFCTMPNPQAPLLTICQLLSLTGSFLGPR